MTEKLIAFARSFFGYAGSRAGIAFAFVMAAAVLEGIGILALVPVLDLALGGVSSSSTGDLSRMIAAFGFETPGQQLAAILSGFVVLVALRGLLGWARDIRLMRLSLGFVDHWRARLFTALTEADWATSTRLTRAHIEHALMDDVSRISFGTDRILRGLAGLCMLAAQGLIAVILSPILTALVLAFIVIAAVLAIPLIKSAQRIGARLTVAGQALFELVGHFLSGLKLAKAHRAEAHYIARFEETLADVRQQIIEFAGRQAMMRAAFQFFTGILASAVILVGVLVLHTPIAVLAVFTLILARLTGPFLALLQDVQSFANMLPAFDNVQHLLGRLEQPGQANRPPRKAKRPAPASVPTGPGATPALPALIELSNVSFTHADQTEPVLDDVSIKFAAGEFIGIVGPSGAGKTTLGDIVVGLHAPQTGHVAIDGRQLVGTELAQWQDRIAYVPQEPFLFDVSIRENLTWGRANVTDAVIWQALETVSADAFVRALPHGLATRVGDRGQALSGGERQRLCLARALVRQPSLLVLDEATNALDTATENRLLAGLCRSRHVMTVIMITHRTASLGVADRVLEVAHGNVRTLPVTSGHVAADVA